MLDINGTDIEINKKNAVFFTITLTGDDAPEDGTTVFFVVKKSPSYENNIISKELVVENGVLNVQMDPVDTEDICPGTYYWNLIIQFDAGEAPWTISKKALRFTILPEIGSGGV